MARREHYLFDVDGTLTMPRRKMEAPFTMSFLGWMRDRSVFLVAGSDISKVKQQVPDSVLSRCSGIFCSMGNEFWSNGCLVYRKEWKAGIKLLSRLTEIHRNSEYEAKKGNWLEHRPGMINFSIAGRDSNLKERQNYFEWDKKNSERLGMVKNLKKEFPNLDFSIGGQVSIDINPKGNNKSLASKWIRENIGGRIYFFGDSCRVGGNDYDIYLDVEKNKDGEAYAVKSPEDTLKILEALDE
jgi:phosphomannomutase